MDQLPTLQKKIYRTTFLFKIHHSICVVSNLSTVSISDQIENNNITAFNLLVEWTSEEIQQLFSSKYRDYASKFLLMDGKDFAGLSKEDSNLYSNIDLVIDALQQIKVPSNQIT